MNPESENFELLRRLMALKKHEVPPPGYFHHFSGDVIARIKAGERGEQEGALTWLRRLWEAFEARPIFAGALGAAVCGLLISAAVSPDDNAASIPGAMTMAMNNQANARPDTAVPITPSEPVETLVAFNSTPRQPEITSSTNAVGPSLNSLFDHFQVRTMPAAYNLPGGN